LSAAVAAFFVEGHAVDAVLGVLGLEAVWLAARRRTDVIPALLPAVPILLALRAALTGDSWPWVAGWLALSLPVHLWDLSRRLKRRA